MKHVLFCVAVLALQSMLYAGENLLIPDKWTASDPAKAIALPDGVFRMTTPDDKNTVIFRQTVMLNRKEIVPIHFGAAFRTVEKNTYSRREDSYGIYMNLTYDDGSCTRYISIGPKPANPAWEPMARTYRPKRPVVKAEVFLRLAKRAAVVEIKDVFLKEKVPLSSKAMIDHGIGVEACELRHAIAGKDAAGRPFILGAMLDNGPDRYLLYTELDTGKTFQYIVPYQRGFFSGAVLTPNGKYVTALAGKVVIFDVNTRKITLPSTPPIGSTSWSAAIGPDGWVYLGNVPCTLVAVNPETGEVKNCGRIDPVETQLYWIAGDKKGWLYCGNGVARSGVVAYNPKTGEKRELIPDQYRKLGSGYVAELPDGTVYINTPSGFSAICEGGEIMQTQVPRPREAQRPHLKYGTRKYTISDTQKVIAYNNHKNCIIWSDNGVLKNVPYTYKSGGASLTSLAAGPDGRIYISSAHPHHLSTLDPKTGKITDHGYNPTVGGGNFCNLTSANGKMYSCEYSHGRMWELDPAKPIRYTARSFFGVPMTTLAAQMPGSENHQFNIIGEILLCMGKENGTPFKFRVPVEKDGQHYINMRFYHFQTYGTVTVKVQDKSFTLDLCREIAGLGDVINMGPFDLKKGECAVEISVKKSPKGKYPWFGLAGLEAASAPRKDETGMDNPRILGQWAKAVMRPRTIQVHPNGREVMMAGFSYDGMEGGQFGIHDLQTGKNRTIADWLPGESCIASEFEKDGNLIGGTSIAAIGGHSTVKEACVFRMDWKTGKVVNVFRVPRAGNVFAVALWRGKILAATDTSYLYVIDPLTFKLERQYKTGYPVRRAFQQTEDGRMFYIQGEYLSELDPETFKPEPFASPLAAISGGGAIADGRIYFIAENRMVHSCAIPAAKNGPKK